MKFYKTQAGDVYSFESYDEALLFGPTGLVPMTDEEVAEHTAPKPLTYAQELATLNAAYSADRLELCQAWLVAAVADGVAETERKADVEAELDELDAQHAVDITELKAKYGVS